MLTSSHIQEADSPKDAQEAEEHVAKHDVEAAEGEGEKTEAADEKPADAGEAKVRDSVFFSFVFGMY